MKDKYLNKKSNVKALLYLETVYPWIQETCTWMISSIILLVYPFQDFESSPIKVNVPAHIIASYRKWIVSFLTVTAFFKRNLCYI